MLNSTPDRQARIAYKRRGAEFPVEVPSVDAHEVKLRVMIGLCDGGLGLTELNLPHQVTVNLPTFGAPASDS